MHAHLSDFVHGLFILFVLDAFRFIITESLGRKHISTRDIWMMSSGVGIFVRWIFWSRQLK